MGWIDEKLGITSSVVQAVLIVVWQYGMPILLAAFGLWLLIQPRLRLADTRRLNSSEAIANNNTLPLTDRTPFPDWPIRELFYYLQPNLVDDSASELWKIVGSKVHDQLSIGRLQIWGREFNPTSKDGAPLKEIDKSYWHHAAFSYWFLGDNQEEVNHTNIPQGSKLAKYCDLNVNKEQALRIWPKPSEDKPHKLVNSVKPVIGFTLIKRGAEPELHMLLRSEDKGDVTNTLDGGWPDHYVTETFFEFAIADELREAKQVQLRFDISRTSNSTYAGNVAHYSGAGAADVRQFGTGLPLTRIELTRDSFKINITHLVKQYTDNQMSFIGFRFFNPEAAKDQTKQFFVFGGHLEAY